jgi:hypothetical protein
VEDASMDNFFWDDIFGDRKRLTEEAVSPFAQANKEGPDPCDVVAVIIAWAPRSTSGPPRPKGFSGR